MVPNLRVSFIPRCAWLLFPQAPPPVPWSVSEREVGDKHLLVFGYASLGASAAISDYVRMICL